MTPSSVPVAAYTGGVLAGKRVIAICGNYDCTTALTHDGKVFAWGAGNYGGLGDASTTNSLVPVAAYAGGVLAGQTVAAISASSQAHHTIALTLNISPPVFTSGNSATGTHAATFSFNVTANNADSFSALGLPSGLSIDPASGLISGIPSDVGTFAISLQATNVFGSTSTNLSLTIGQSVLNVSGLSAGDKVYDNTLVAAISGTPAPVGVYGSESVSIIGTPVGAFADSNVGSGKAVSVSGFSLSGSDAAKYILTEPTLSASITKATLTATADNQTRLYGQANPTLTISYAGFASGDSASVLTAGPVAATTATPASPTATYPITLSGGVSSNYNFNLVAGTLTVNKTPLTMVGDSFTRAYGQADPVFTATITGVVNGDHIGAGFTTAATTDSLSGSYRIRLNVSDPDAKLGNYLTTLTSGILTITNGLLVGQVASNSRAYGQTNPVFTVSYSGFVNGQGTNLLSDPLVISCVDTNGMVVDTNTAVGQYAISVTSGQSAPNYTVVYQDGTLTVTQVVLNVTANDATRVYGDSNPSFDGVISGYVNGEDSNVLSGMLVFNTEALTNSPVGSYPIVPSGLSASNYTIEPHNGTLTVTAAAMVVSADNQARLYGQSNPALTGSLNGVKAGDNLAVSFVTVATPASPVGGYDIVPVWQDADGRLSNYNISTNVGILTVGQAPLAVRADNQTRVYGASNSVLTVSYSGFVNGDSAATALTGAPELSTIATAASPAGSYPIAAAIGSLSAANYNLQLANGTLLVTPAVLTVSADNQSRLYGATNPVLTATLSGFVNGDGTNVVVGSADLSTPAVLSSPVGAYDIVAAVGSLNATNYSFVTTNGVLTVGKALLTVAANSQTRLYGAANPAVTYTYSGWLDGDDTNVLSGAPALSTDVSTNSAVGAYTIYVAQGTLSATNYVFAFTNNLLTITPAALEVAANAQSRIYGQTNPTLTGTLSGVMNGDDLTPSFSTEAAVSSPVGLYDIVPAINDPSNKLGNYTVTTNKATLTITAAALVVSADNQTRLYGAANPALTGTLVGVTNSDPISASFTTTATPQSPVGTYAILPVFTDPAGKLGNYTITTNVGTLTLTKALLTVTAANQSRPYGHANPPLTYGYSGFLNNDDASLLTTVPLAATPAVPSSWLGTYPITLSGGVSSNYDFNYVNGTLAVTKAELIVTGDDAGRPYGQANPVFTATMVGVAAGDAITFSLSTVATTNSLPAQYDIDIFLDDPNSKLGAYDVTLLSGVLSVTNAVLTGQVASQTRAYGQTNAPFAVTYSGFVNGQGTNLLTGNMSYSCLDSHGVSVRTNTPVSAYVIHGSGQHAANYTVVYVDGSLTVSPAALLARADNQSRIYGASNQPLTITYSGFVNNENVSILPSAPSVATDATTNRPVGTYPITLSGGSGGNYLLSLNNGVLSVTPATLTVSADNQSRVYGTTNPVLTATLSGFVNGEDTNVVSGSAELSTPAVLSSPVGAYDIVAAVGSLSATNYSFVTTNGVLTVGKALLTVAANDQSRLYGAANPALTYTYSGWLDGDDTNVLSGAPSLSTSAGTNSPVGSYDILITQNTLSATNYAFGFTNSTLSVTRAPLTITANDQSRTYGSANPELTSSYSGFVNNEGTNVLDALPVAGTLADANSSAGIYPITLTGGSAGNYELTLVPGTLTVTKATVVATADPQSRLYGQANPTLSISYSGFVNGQDSSVLDTLPTADTTANLTSPVADYLITLSGGADPNYNITLVGGTLSVTRATITARADDQSRVYGAANPVLTIRYSGFANNEDTSVFDSLPVASTTADAASVVGGYPITLSGGSAHNYDFNLVAGTLTVGPATLLATADSQIRAYGATNPVLTASYSGFVNGQNSSLISGQPALSTSAETNSLVGQYDIVIGPGTLSVPNYTFQYVNDQMVVTQAVLTVSADNQSRVYGTTNPVLTATISGFVNGEDTNVVSGSAELSTPAVLSSPVGTYDIVAGTGSLSATNYSFVTTNGVLTVGKALLVVAANSQTRLYGAANPALTYTYSGFVDGDTAGVLSGAPALSTDASTNSPVGAYAIVVGQGNLGSTNYAFGFTNGTLTVGQAALTVSADNQSRGYGAADPAFTGLLAGVLNNDNLTATFASAATVSSPVGQYDILPVFNDPDGRLANYSVTTNKGTLSVTQVGLTVSADNQSRAYGAANPMLTGTLTGVVNGDNVTAGFDTIAGAASSVGAYDIVLVFNDPDGKLSNYTISTNKGTLTVSAAGSTLALSSSANPTPTGSNVTLTVTVGPVPPSSAVPTGSVQFLVDGQVFGWPLPLSGGLARLSTANLTHGLHSVCVQYTSDGNFNSSTNTLNGALLVNSAPVAGPMTLSTARNQAASLSLDTVLAKCSDPEQDALSITSVNAISAQGGTVVLGAVCITYTSPSNYSGPDSFTFTVQDAYAASATGTISVTVRPPIPPLLSAITRQADGNVKLSASGEPNQAYLVQAGTDLVNWSVISTNTADTNGAVLFLDLDATNYSTRFYRLAVP